MAIYEVYVVVWDKDYRSPDQPPSVLHTINGATNMVERIANDGKVGVTFNMVYIPHDFMDFTYIDAMQGSKHVARITLNGVTMGN